MVDRKPSGLQRRIKQGLAQGGNLKKLPERESTDNLVRNIVEKTEQRLKGSSPNSSGSFSWFQSGKGNVTQQARGTTSTGQLPLGDLLVKAAQAELPIEREAWYALIRQRIKMEKTREE